MSSIDSNGSSNNNRWWSDETVVVVTGANKGIGLAMVDRLVQLGLTVVLTSRDIPKGRAAVESLNIPRHRIEFHQLDVADHASINAFASWLRQRLGGLDILVNNAGVSFNDVNENSVEHAETVIRTNFHGPKLLIEALLPLFRRSPYKSRILNLSSQLGLLSKVRNPSLRMLLQDEEKLSEEMIERMVAKFLDDVKNGRWREEGWPKVWTDYAVSKLALNAYSMLLARQNAGHLLSVNCFCPGFTKTNMTGGLGHRTAAEAAEAGAMIVLLPLEELPTGVFFKWTTHNLYSKM